MDMLIGNRETQNERSPFPQSKPSAVSPLLNTSGVGIHTGKNTFVSVEYAAEDGIHFSFANADQIFKCPAHWERLSGTTRTTALVMRCDSRQKIQVAMIEHFMAAAHIWRLSSLELKLSLEGNLTGDTVELPILDGSALPWCRSLAAQTRISSEQPVWVVTSEFEHTDGQRKVRFSPHSSESRKNLSSYTFTGSFGEIHQRSSFVMNWIDPKLSQIDFMDRIAPARTFGFRQEVEALRARGLALGGSLDNALVIDGKGFVNPEGERVENELASHKLLDAIGDFALATKPILGEMTLQGSGHALHLHALKLAFETGCLQPGFLMSDGRVIVACR